MPGSLRRAGVAPLIALYAGFGVTAAAAAVVVAIGLLLPWPVATTCTVGAALFALSALACGLTAPRPLLPERADLAGVLVFLVAFGGVAAFNAVPSVPDAQYPMNSVGGGLVHSARWPVMSIDNVLPFRTGQVALHKLGGDDVRDGFSLGWWITDRGPLTGLGVAFAAGSAQVGVPADDIQAVRPAITAKDAYGFWAHGIVAIMFNLAIVLGAHLLGHVWTGRRIALVAALVTALAPGVFLNALYTSPKQAVAYFVLIGAVFGLRRVDALWVRSESLTAWCRTT